MAEAMAVLEGLAVAEASEEAEAVLEVLEEVVSEGVEQEGLGSLLPSWKLKINIEPSRRPLS